MKGAVDSINRSCATHNQSIHRQMTGIIVPTIKRITTPIFYANASPHIGHLYSALIADVWKRNSLLKGEQCLLSTGTDEHGIKVLQAAEYASIPVTQYCDNVSGEFRALFHKSNIEFDMFIRTTQERHSVSVQSLWSRLESNGFIYKTKYEGWYDVREEAFLPRSDPRAQAAMGGEVDSGLQWVAEPNYKFALSKFQQRLRDWLLSSDVVITPETQRQDMLSFIDKGLEDISVSRVRSRSPWAIPVPGDTDQSVYVWLDALANYLTVSGYPEKKLRCWPPSVHVVGKDIMRFHAIYWPAFLMAAGLELPKCIVSHAHWLCSGTKMSKSLKNIVCPSSLINRFGVDAVRFYLMKGSVLTDDSSFSTALLRETVNSDLADTLGNLISRTCKLALDVERYPPVSSLLHPSLVELSEIFRVLPGKVDNAIEVFDMADALRLIVTSLHRVNAAFTYLEPWKLAKNRDQREELHNVLHISLEAIRITSILLLPFVPGTASLALNHIGIPEQYWTMSEAKCFGVGTIQSRGLSKERLILFTKIPAEDNPKNK